MAIEIPGEKVKGLMMRAEAILNTVGEWPDEQQGRRIQKARALIELAQLKRSLIELTATEDAS